MGMPIRLVISQKGLDEDLVEIKVRATGEVMKVKKEDAIQTIKDLLK